MSGGTIDGDGEKSIAIRRVNAADTVREAIVRSRWKVGGRETTF